MRKSDMGAIVVVVVMVSLMVFVVPTFHRTERAPSRRAYCKNNLKNIAIGLHNYHNTYGSLPPAYIADENGRPMHSWRVLILPFVDQKPLYDLYDFSVPWDHPKNRRLLDEMPMPEVYCCLSDEEKRNTDTSYFACLGPNCAFKGETPVRFSDMTDGQNNTLLVGEAIGVQAPWTKPQDIDVAKLAQFGSPGCFSSAHSGGVHFVLADGAVYFFTHTIDRDTLRNLATINDGNETRY